MMSDNHNWSVDSMRGHFPDMPTDVIYLDCAGRSPLPVKTEEVGIAALSWKKRPWQVLLANNLAVRKLYATLIRAESHHSIALAPSTSFAISSAADNIVASGDLRTGRSIIVMEGEMESNVYPWQHACKKTGASMVIVPESQKSWAEAICEVLDSYPPESIAVVAVSMVHWCTGEIVNVKDISNRILTIREKFRSNTPYLIIDGTQTVGVQPVDVQALRPDLMAGSVHKWLLSPYGCSIVYLNPRHHDTWEPLDKNDRNRVGNCESEWVENAYMNSDELVDGAAKGYPMEYTFGASRIMCGGRPNPILLPMVQESLDLLVKKCSIGEIDRYLFSLGDILEASLYSDNSVAVPGEWSHVGIKMLPKYKRSCNIIGIRLHPALNLSPSDMVAKLKQRGIIVAARQLCIRISPHLYNTSADMTRLCDAMHDIIMVSGLRTPVPLFATVPCVRRRKVLIIGGSGWLGQFLCKALLHPSCSSELQAIFSPDNFELHITYNSTRPRFLPWGQCHRLDLAKPPAHGDLGQRLSSCYLNGCLLGEEYAVGESWDVESLIAYIQPDVVIHTAAQASPLKCETDPLLAQIINCPTALTNALREKCPRSLLLYTSTDLVYDGEHAPYGPVRPDDVTPAPSTVYGQTKLSFEREVVQYERGLVLRLSNMVGGGYVYNAPRGGGGMKFFQWIQKSFLRKEKVRLKNDEVRSFVYVEDVVSLITHITYLHLSGNLNDYHPCWTQRVYNVGGATGLSRLEFARSVAQANGSDIIYAQLMSARNTDAMVNRGDTVETGCDEINHSSLHRWEVESVSSASIMNASQAPAGISVPPRNVTMDISLTTEHFGVSFGDLNNILPRFIDTLL